MFNPNENVATNSSYLVKDRINALFNFQKAFFGTYKTRFGVFYEGRSGKPYSWTVNNDLNGDGLAGNDLMYIPKAFGSGEVVFAGDTATNHANEQKFWDVVNANKVLRNSAGGVVGRNTDFAPWTNSFDMRISQEIPGMFGRNKASFSLDILNVGNLLNKKWGHINEVGFQSRPAVWHAASSTTPVSMRAASTSTPCVRKWKTSTSARSRASRSGPCRPPSSTSSNAVRLVA